MSYTDIAAEGSGRVCKPFLHLPWLGASYQIEEHANLPA